MTKRLVWVGLLAAATLLLAAACGGDDGGDGGEDAGATAEAGDTATATETAAAGGGTATEASGEDDDEDAAALLERYRDVEFSATYQATGGGPGGAFDGQFVMYQGDGRTRTDIVTAEGSFTTIITDEAAIFCSIEEETCFDAGALGGVGADPSAVLVGSLADLREADTPDNLVEEGTRTIAGVEATCFTVQEGAGSNTVCVSEEGVMLALESDDGAGNTWTLEATEFTASVSDADFEPPFPITSFGG